MLVAFLNGVIAAALLVGCSAGEQFEAEQNDGGGASSSSGSGGSSGASTGGSGGSGTGGSGSGTGGSGASPSGGSAGSGGNGGGSSGSTGSGGNGGGTGGSGGAGGSGGGLGGTGGIGPISCRWNETACPAGTFCNAVGCAEGSCAPIPNEGTSRSPVCGCDGVTYWNASVAGHRGMAVKSSGECQPGLFCGGLVGLDCPGDAYCNYRGDSSFECNVSDGNGWCWYMPSTCPTGPGFGPNTRGCDDTICTPECELIKSRTPWYVDNTCPQ